MARTIQLTGGTTNSSVRRLLRLLAGGAFVAILGVAPIQLGTGLVGSSAVAADNDDCGTVTVKADGTPWTCSYVDNFSGGSLDSSKWIVQESEISGFRTGQTCYVASDRNVRVASGELRLTARREWRRFSCETPLGSFKTAYTGGMIGTRTKFSQAYGKFEVRAKYPSVTKPGLHGGFIMLPLNRPYGPWPGSGEIDIAEWWSVDATLALPSLHFIGRDSQVDSGWDCRVASPSSYHTYTLVWLPTEISFFIDGTKCFTRSPTPLAPLVAPQPFDHPYNMVLGMGVGQASGVNAVTFLTPLPATYVVDYAKAWR